MLHTNVIFIKSEMQTEAEREGDNIRENQNTSVHQKAPAIAQAGFKGYFNMHADLSGQH